MDIQPLLKLINEELLLEQFSNWTYKPPTDPEKLLYDFYFFTMFGEKVDTGNVKFDQAINDAVEDATDGLTKHMLKALKFALSSELRHIFDAIDGNVYDYKLRPETKKFIRTFENYLKGYWASQTDSSSKKKAPPKKMQKRMTGPIKGEKQTERVAAYKSVAAAQKKLKISNVELGKMMEEIYRDVDWDSAYGGKAWQSIGEGYKWLAGAKDTKEKMRYIDHAYDLQHNNDTVFQKLQSYYKGGGGEYNWIRRALNWKRDVADIRGFYNKVSPNLKPVVAYAAKNVFSKTMQDYDDPSPKRIWDGGTWKGGTWDGGVWRNGTWENGTWENGTWKRGTWENGTWKDGIWEYGSWYGGTFEGGIFHDGHWANGKWKGGKWNNDANWRRGEIWSKKFKQYVPSEVNPNNFKKKEKEAKNIRDLKLKVYY